MELKPFKLDIDELLHEFVESGSTTLAEFKRVWIAKKFSFIFEASPTINQGFFMQSLYAHSIGYMLSTDSLSNRLGGLYCLYCLYETQPFTPPFKIYLSLGELRQLKTLALDVKTGNVKVASALLKSMLQRNMFLFGFVGANEGTAAQRVNELTDMQNARVRTAYKKLFENSRLEHFIHLDMGAELEVDLLKKKSSDYAVAKEIAIKEASRVIDVGDIQHLTENKKLIGEVVEKAAMDWSSQKEVLYKQMGLVGEDTQRQSHADNTKQIQTSCNSENSEWHENFGEELEGLLFQPLGSDNENSEPEGFGEEDA